MNIDKFHPIVRALNKSKPADLDFRLVNEGHSIHGQIVNNNDQVIEVDEIVLYRGAHGFQSNAKVYGEGYNMLSQYGGTIAEQRLIGQYGDRDHYKMQQRIGFHTVYNMIVFSETRDGKEWHLLIGFASCRKFNGLIRYNENELEIVLDTEGLPLIGGDAWELEELVWIEGEDVNRLYQMFAESISANHPILPYSDVPTGWCSWYCYGPDVTEGNILDNLTVISDRSLDLKFIQIDDGYQAHMGDWLIPNPSFSGDVSELCSVIKEKGFEPAIWVAPFIAEPGSRLFGEHPDWFVHDVDGTPLASDKISFGGWRCGPWYMLDGSHPEARQYLKQTFKTMKEKWGCTYFKLDANMWGALHGGKRYDPAVTKIEAYRLGMQAIIEAVGEDAFILGCNAPMWPSLGLVHGMRVTDDISREWRILDLVARQGFHRNWQHRKLWINDPDCLVISNGNVALPGPDGEWRIACSELTDDEFQFHATYIAATGGMVLSGDDLTNVDTKRSEIIRKALLLPKMSAIFENDEFAVGRISEGAVTYLFLFNWGDNERSFHVSLPGLCLITDYWTGMNLGIHDGKLRIEGVPARSARLLAAL